GSRPFHFSFSSKALYHDQKIESFHLKVINGKLKFCDILKDIFNCKEHLNGIIGNIVDSDEGCDRFTLNTMLKTFESNVNQDYSPEWWSTRLTSTEDADRGGPQ
ncbi:hypothetical protein STEG23_012300, partial [Scotinomys teguina]